MLKYTGTNENVSLTIKNKQTNVDGALYSEL